MRSTVIPAQITSVEDKITSFLNLKQIVILVLDLILIIVIFLIIPPLVKFSLLKMILSVTLSLLIVPLIIKYRDVILLDYLVLMLSFKLRPKIYVLRRDSQDDIEPEANKNQALKALRTKFKKSQLIKFGFSYGCSKKGEVYVEFFK